MEVCPNFSPVAWTRPNHIPKMVWLARLRCKRWDCDYCAKINKAVWRKFLLERLSQMNKDWYSVTLTAHGKMRSQQQSYENLAHGVDVLMKRIRRIWGKVDYVRVYEKHPTSEALHAHLIVSQLTPFVVPGAHRNHQPGFLGVTQRPSHDGFWTVRSWIKGAAHECKIGYQADAKELEGLFAVYYITKYLSKALQDIHIKGLRHVQTSRGVGTAFPESGLSWQVAPFVSVSDFSGGEHVYNLSDKSELDASYWEEHDTYPPYEP